MRAASSVHVDVVVRVTNYEVWPFPFPVAAERPPMPDESDSEQARLLYTLLRREADELTAVLAADLTRRGTPRSTTESRRLARDLDEIHRCLAKLAARFPEAVSAESR